MAAAASTGFAWINPTYTNPAGKANGGGGTLMTKYAAFAEGYITLIAKFLSNAMAEV